MDGITEQIRNAILSGQLQPGEKLPAERELAGQLGVNRLTLRAALSRLEAIALIDTRHGTRSVVRNFRENAGIDTFPDLIRLCRENDPPLFVKLARDVFDLRRALAIEAVAFAAERRTDEDLAAIRAAVALQQARIGDVLAFARGDLHVARLVVRASKNLALEMLLNTIMRVPEDDPMLLRAMYPSPRAQYRHYDVVLHLIETGAGALARDAMRSALEALDRVTMARLERETSKGTP